MDPEAPNSHRDIIYLKDVISNTKTMLDSYGSLVEKFKKIIERNLVFPCFRKNHRTNIIYNKLISMITLYPNDIFINSILSGIPFRDGISLDRAYVELTKVAIIEIKLCQYLKLIKNHDIPTSRECIKYYINQNLPSEILKGRITIPGKYDLIIYNAYIFSNEHLEESRIHVRNAISFLLGNHSSCCFGEVERFNNLTEIIDLQIYDFLHSLFDLTLIFGSMIQIIIDDETISDRISEHFGNAFDRNTFEYFNLLMLLIDNHNILGNDLWERIRLLID